MFRRLFIMAAAISALLFVAVSILWIRSYIVGEYVQWAIAGWPGEFIVTRGRVEYHRQDIFVPTIRAQQPRWRWAHGTFKPLDRDTQWGMPPERGWFWHGFGWTTFSTAGGAVVHRYGYVPYWAVAGLSAVCPMIWIFRLRRVQTPAIRGHRGFITLTPIKPMTRSQIGS